MSIQGKRPDLLVRSESPFNAGPAPQQMAAAFITPSDSFFVRNHGDVPTSSSAEVMISVEGLVAHPLSLTLSDIKRFPSVTLVATLQCAGNRRRELARVGPIPDELEWDMEAISTAQWRGARLADVLVAAGVLQGAHHVAFEGGDVVAKAGAQFGFGGSVPLAKALHPDTLLVYEMNGKPLPAAHGAPVRVLVPGYIGARSVKWLRRISVQAEPSDNYFQAQAYRLYPAHASPDAHALHESFMLGELAIVSAILSPLPGETLKAGPVAVRGYALSSGRDITRVDVSADDGANWQTATLLGDAHAWSWRFWEARLHLEPGEHTLVARAWDAAANTQPERLETVWNFKGYMNNAWHRVPISVR